MNEKRNIFGSYIQKLLAGCPTGEILLLKVSHINISLLAIVLFLSSAYKTKADVLTHRWPDGEDYKGYAMKQVFSAGLFVAAGTYHANNGTKGFHFVCLDVDGNIVSTAKYSPDPLDQVELRVVDIVPIETQLSCWVIMQARCYIDFNYTFADFIYAVKIDYFTGMQSAGTNNFHVKMQSHYGLYPTSAVEINNELYIAGYRVRRTSFTVPTSDPTNIQMGKDGMLLKVDGATGSLLDNRMWNTNDNGSFDYDMALKVKVSDRLSTKTLLVTGAANTTRYGSSSPSGVLLIRFDPNSMTPLFSNIVHGAPIGATDNGQFGTDIIESSISLNGDVWVTCNSFVSGFVGQWGILHVNSADLKVDPGVPCILTVNDSYQWNDWAKQIFQGYYSDDFLVIGEAKEITYTNPICTSPLPTLLPSVTNINPFVSSITNLTYNSFTGISGTTGNQYVIQASTEGTFGSQVDYYTPTATVAGSDLEDVTRHYHSAAFVPNMPQPHQPLKMITPMANIQPSTPIYLNYKVQNINFWGNEPHCHREYLNCLPPATTLSQEETSIGSWSTCVWNCNDPLTPYVFTDDLNWPTVVNCTTDYDHQYKPASIAETKTLIETQIYPNPASTEVNIELAKTVSADNDIQVELVNMHGQVISRLFEGKAEVLNGNHTLKLPNVAVGLYMVFIYSNGERIHNQKLEIR